MMKRFCDACGQEIAGPTHVEADVTFAAYPGLCVRVEVGLVHFAVDDDDHEYIDAGHGLRIDVCRHCILDAINRTDDRPRPGPPSTASSS